jgi:hypothetical protein
MTQDTPRGSLRRVIMAFTRRKSGAARRQRRRHLASAFVILGLTAAASACSASSRSAEAVPATTAPHGVAMPASCAQWSCRARQTVSLPDGYAVTLWVGSDQQNYQSRPVVELLDHGLAVQWWISPVGDGWNGTLACDVAGRETNCALLDSVGMHAGVAEMLIRRGGQLAHPTGAAATSNSGMVQAADLNADGYLDVIASINDYRPNYAQGHTYWQTFQFTADRLVLTGCSPQPRGSSPPKQLVTGVCPTPP